MITLNAKLREDKSAEGKIPGVVYGHGTKNANVEVTYEEFKKIFEQSGETSLISLKVEGEIKERPVLIHDIQKNPVSDKFIHIDFYQISLKEEVEVSVPLVFEGISLAVKDLGGTLLREMQEIKVRALPQDLPHDIKVDISSLKTFEDEIQVKDLVMPKGVKAARKPEEVVATVMQPTKIEEDLAKPIEEKVEDVEKIEKEKKVKDEVLPEDKPAVQPKK